jgi:hypothetical protein
VCKLRILASSALIVLAFATSAQTAAPQTAAPAPALENGDFIDYLGEHWSCGKTAHLTQAQIHEILSSENIYTLYARRSRDPIVIAQVPGSALGTMIFRRVGGRWLPAFLTAGSAVQAVLATRDHSRIFIVSLWSREDPGNLAVSSYEWRTGAIRCVDLDEPRDLNTPPEFASFKRLELDAHGRGRLLATSDGDQEEVRGRIYVYKTRDWGRSWAPPKQVAHLPPARNELASVTRRGLDASLRTLIEAGSGQ